MRQTKPCEGCGKLMIDVHSRQMWCSETCRKRNARSRGVVVYTRARVPRICEYCEQPFQARKDLAGRFCSRQCFQASEAAKVTDGLTNAARRARSRLYRVSPVDRWAIFDRDGWRCGICDEDIDRELRYPDPWSVSLDHIIPLSLGGLHEPHNVQAAHLECNIRKGAQVALVGRTDGTTQADRPGAEPAV